MWPHWRKRQQAKEKKNQAQEEFSGTYRNGFLQGVQLGRGVPGGGGDIVAEVREERLRRHRLRPQGQRRGARLPWGASLAGGLARCCFRADPVPEKLAGRAKARLAAGRSGRAHTRKGTVFTTGSSSGSSLSRLQHAGGGSAGRRHNDNLAAGGCGAASRGVLSAGSCCRLWSGRPFRLPSAGCLVGARRLQDDDVATALGPGAGLRARRLVDARRLHDDDIVTTPGPGAGLLPRRCGPSRSRRWWPGAGLRGRRWAFSWSRPRRGRRSRGLRELDRDPAKRPGLRRLTGRKAKRRRKGETSNSRA